MLRKLSQIFIKEIEILAASSQNGVWLYVKRFLCPAHWHTYYTIVVVVDGRWWTGRPPEMAHSVFIWAQLLGFVIGISTSMDCVYVPVPVDL